MRKYCLCTLIYNEDEEKCIERIFKCIAENRYKAMDSVIKDVKKLNLGYVVSFKYVERIQ